MGVESLPLPERVTSLADLRVLSGRHGLAVATVLARCLELGLVVESGASEMTPGAFWIWVLVAPRVENDEHDLADVTSSLISAGFYGPSDCGHGWYVALVQRRMQLNPHLKVPLPLAVVVQEFERDGVHVSVFRGVVRLWSDAGAWTDELRAHARDFGFDGPIRGDGYEAWQRAMGVLS